MKQNQPAHKDASSVWLNLMCLFGPTFGIVVACWLPAVLPRYPSIYVFTWPFSLTVEEYLSFLRLAPLPGALCAATVAKLTPSVKTRAACENLLVGCIIAALIVFGFWFG